MSGSSPKNPGKLSKGTRPPLHHLVARADAHSPEGRLEGDGAVREESGMPAPNGGGKLEFEGRTLRAGAVVHQAGAENRGGGIDLVRGEVRHVFFGAARNLNG